MVSDDATVAQLTVAFQRMGANAEQARIMAAQLLKRARQLAHEKGIAEESALAGLLAKVASGGELSRIGLAISVLATQANPVPTLIFDEADAGVGGAVADAIGELMRQLGSDRQVLCVTHLPQVASKAHHHYRVSKETADGRTVSRIEALDRGARVEEVARMLGGAEITATTRKHARELLAAQA